MRSTIVRIAHLAIIGLTDLVYSSTEALLYPTSFGFDKKQNHYRLRAMRMYIVVVGSYTELLG